MYFDIWKYCNVLGTLCLHVRVHVVLDKSSLSVGGVGVEGVEGGGLLRAGSEGSSESNSLFQCTVLLPSIIIFTAFLRVSSTTTLGLI